jgi:hypothetical protein
MEIILEHDPIHKGFDIVLREIWGQREANS